MHKIWTQLGNLSTRHLPFQSICLASLFLKYIIESSGHTVADSICESSIESSTVLSVIRKNGAWQGNYVNRLFDLNWRSCWFLLFSDLLDGYYVAPLLVQTSQVLLAFMDFDWLWLHLRLHLVPRIQRVRRQGRSKPSSRLWRQTWEWNLGAFDTQNISQPIHLETAFVRKGVGHLDNFQLVINQTGIVLNGGCSDWIKTHQVAMKP